MKEIISWNVNGIRACARKGFFEWMQQSQADIICLQETKAQPQQLGEEFHAQSGYQVFWSSAEKKGYSGVAVYSKEKPLAVEKMGIDDFDSEGRLLCLHFDDFSLINAYFPNSQDAGKRLDYKLAFCQAILELCINLVNKKKNILLCGDYNIAHKAIDLARPEANENSPGYLPQERAWMDEFTTAGFIDSFRHFTKESGHYSWWSYRARGARERNVGWRLDYHCINQAFLPKLIQSDIMPEIMGSDHCPVRVKLEL